MSMKQRLLGIRLLLICVITQLPGHMVRHVFHSFLPPIQLCATTYMLFILAAITTAGAKLEVVVVAAAAATYMLFILAAITTAGAKLEVVVVAAAAATVIVVIVAAAAATATTTTGKTL